MSTPPTDRAPSATVKLPGSFCDWLAATLAALGPAPALDDVRATLDAARRTERRHGYFLTLDASAPVLDMLAALAADCVNLGRPATGHNTREAARTARLRLAAARTRLTDPDAQED
jgi:predicted kinase